MAERYVVAGLARARTEWFAQVGRWASDASIPVEFVRCVSVAELRGRLEGGRAFSAVLLGGDVDGVDRDLLARVRDVAAAPVVVDTGTGRAWADLGAAAVLPATFGREDLLETLANVAVPVDQVAEHPPAAVELDPPRPLGRLVAVTGPGGTGASTVAIALAQGLADAGRGPVLLADLRRAAEQAVLHDSRAVVPGLQEVVEAHRGAQPGVDAVRAVTFDVSGRGYRLLLGLRRVRHWATLRPAALGTALAGLQGAFAITVADVDPDVDGEEETGSADVEERHLASRLTLARADVVLVVGGTGMKGLYSLSRLLGELLAFGIPAERLVPVLNRAPRRRRARAELAASLAHLLDGQLAGAALASPVQLPERRVEEALRDGTPLPEPLPGGLAAVVGAFLERPRGAVPDTSGAPTPITPGSLGLASEGGAP